MCVCVYWACVGVVMRVDSSNSSSMYINCNCCYCLCFCIYDSVDVQALQINYVYDMLPPLKRSLWLEVAGEKREEEECKATAT